MKRKKIAKLLSGETVYNRPRAYMNQVSSRLLKSSIRVARLSPELDYDTIEIQHDQPVGHSICVPTTDTDEIVWLRKPGQEHPSRFVLNREPVPTNLVTIVIKRIPEHPDQCLLIAAWIGFSSRVENFWENHALLLPLNMIPLEWEIVAAPAPFKKLLLGGRG